MSRARAGRGSGPGSLVVAAFIGPGTVTTCTLAGVQFGYRMLWALAFSVGATLVLQEMSARLGLVTGAGLGEAIRARWSGLTRVLAVGLVVAAIGVGNAAFQTGNLLGSALGASELLGGSARAWAIATAALAAALLWTGRYRAIERTLVILVGLMAVAFVTTAVASRPSLTDLAAGFVPSLPGRNEDALLVALGLIGTTVVPYNLFLHATAVSRRWDGPEALPAARWDLVVAILIGGAVSAAIVVTAASAGVATVRDAADMARQLRPLLGDWANVLFALGLAAAGLTSSITAPLAAAWAVGGALGWSTGPDDRRTRAVWIAVLLVGVAFAVTGVRAVPAILFAQVANGLLLPAVALFLLAAVNDLRRMGGWSNRQGANMLAMGVIGVTVVLGARAVWRALIG
ncbi:MAG: Nramp family divalent metal transporter [Gemmatimonadota bacterium]